MTISAASPTRKVIRGDSDKFTLTFNNVTKNNLGVKIKVPIDITDWDIRFTVRKTIPSTEITNDTDAVISKIGQIVDGTTGQAFIFISKLDTNIDEGEYWYDIQFIKNKNTANEVTKSISKGKYVIISDITRNIGT